MQHNKVNKSGRKYNLPVAEVRRMLDEGMRQIDVARHFGVSQPVISRLFRTTATGTAIKEADPTAHFCSCCQQRPVAEGHRLLCAWCYRHADAEDHALDGHMLYV